MKERGRQLRNCTFRAFPYSLQWSGRIFQESSETTTESTLDSEQLSETENIESNLSTRNILIVYFSRRGNTDYPDDVDATTSASIVVDEETRYGTTLKLLPHARRTSMNCGM